jgi:micrococcal nuclease
MQGLAMTRQYRRWPPLHYALLAIVALFIGGRVAYDRLSTTSVENERYPAPPAEGGLLVAGSCEVIRVVDGDTLIVRQGGMSKQGPAGNGGTRAGDQAIRVRLLGIDTPETVKEGTPVEQWGPEATEFTRRFLRRGEARLELDKRRLDRFGRSLAYLYVGEEMLNVEIVRAGLARVSHYPGDSMAMLRLLRTAESAARAERRGLWSKAGGALAPAH